jgi:Mn2+/Fe2+ NRAMP family transporter
MVSLFLLILIDIFFMIRNYIEYKKYNRWQNAFAVIVIFILAMFTIYFR